MVEFGNPMPTGWTFIQPATSSAKSMSQVPAGACRTPEPEMALPAPPAIEGSRKSFPSPSAPMPSVVHCAEALHHAGVTPPTGVHAALAVAPRPSPKRTMKSPRQFTHGPLLLFGKPVGSVFELPKSQGLVWPPMYQAPLKSISATGYAVLV